jgi:hypothetical protein
MEMRSERNISFHETISTKKKEKLEKECLRVPILWKKQLGSKAKLLPTLEGRRAGELTVTNPKL